MAMAQVIVKRTAWKRSLEDYAYAAGLDRPGWAWEYLRRNQDYHLHWQSHKDLMPKLQQRRSGVSICRLRQPCAPAEQWGLSLFIDPQMTALDAGILWHSTATSCQVCCVANPKDCEKGLTETLSNFCGRKHVLSCNGVEYVIIQSGSVSVRLAVKGASLLKGNCDLIYQIEGLERLNAVAEALANLRRMKCESQIKESAFGQTELRLRECLVALDGHLARRSYRDIAEVLYGSDRVKEVWTNETRHLKDKVRRAVASGIDYMNGGYRKLLQ